MTTGASKTALLKCETTKDTLSLPPFGVKTGSSGSNGVGKLMASWTTVGTDKDP